MHYAKYPMPFDHPFGWSFFVHKRGLCGAIGEGTTNYN